MDEKVVEEANLTDQVNDRIVLLIALSFCGKLVWSKMSNILNSMGKPTLL